MKKAIVAVPYLSGKGGTETVIKNFYEAVVANDSEIDWKLVSFGGSKYLDWIKNWEKRVYNFSDKRIIQLGAYVTIMPNLLRKIIKNEKPDYFIATNPVIWNLASKFKIKYSPTTKIIAWYHYSYKMKNVNPKYLKNVDKFWAISSGIKEELEELGVPSEKINVIFNPIDLKNVPLVKRSRIHNHFIYIGRIDYDGQKNVSELMKALNLVKEDYKVDLYGAVDSELKKELLNLIDDKNKRKNIIFHGFSTNVWKKIKEADALVLTSKYEGLPMVLCEAASRGIVLVASDCPTGVKDIVTKNNGFLYKPGNVLELSNVLSNLLDSKSFINQKSILDSIYKFSYKNYHRKIKGSL
ncbi:glycosyltransferase [Lactobacillus rodentium]|uniref:Putative glycosyltransferase n=1 Tax=Lactobacillus rodentium TaxID=947835 RepID=A0A2Z6TQB9_9LACO|nr:glycosyltransferase [Lactobacillus rodentium]MCR1894762.1 glycosyltransferase [Lactobacillus rodentium]GBG04987.1 putative glycosyltransferase [Lactobacillus rodentium]